MRTKRRNGVPRANEGLEVTAKDGTWEILLGVVYLMGGGRVLDGGRIRYRLVKWLQEGKSLVVVYFLPHGWLPFQFYSG